MERQISLRDISCRSYVSTCWRSLGVRRAAPRQSARRCLPGRHGFASFFLQLMFNLGARQGEAGCFCEGQTCSVFSGGRRVRCSCITPLVVNISHETSKQPEGRFPPFLLFSRLTSEEYGLNCAVGVPDEGNWSFHLPCLFCPLDAAESYSLDLEGFQPFL